MWRFVPFISSQQQATGQPRADKFVVARRSEQCRVCLGCYAFHSSEGDVAQNWFTEAPSGIPVVTSGCSDVTGKSQSVDLKFSWLPQELRFTLSTCSLALKSLDQAA